MTGALGLPPPTQALDPSSGLGGSTELAIEGSISLAPPQLDLRMILLPSKTTPAKYTCCALEHPITYLDDHDTRSSTMPLLSS